MKKHAYTKPESQVVVFRGNTLMTMTATGQGSAVSYKAAPIISSTSVTQDSEQNSGTEGVAGKDGLVYDETWGVWDEEE